MKKLILFSSALCIVTLMHAQTNTIDELFNKYSEREGFTTVTISGKLLRLFAGKEAKEDGSNIVNRLTSIKILSVGDSILNQSVNFYRELSNKMDLTSYEELMVVKEGQNMSKFLVKQKGDIISELVVITGGPGDNTLISIKGDLDLKSLSELSEGTGIDELRDLEKIDAEKP